MSEINRDLLEVARALYVVVSATVDQIELVKEQDAAFRALLSKAEEVFARAKELNA